MNRTVNIRLLLVLLGAFAVLGPAIHFLHGQQMQHNAGAFARQARRAEAQGDLARAVRYYDRYLEFVPDDTEALAELGRVLQRLAENPLGRLEALERLEQVLRRDPSRRDLRWRVVYLAIDQRRFRDAISHLHVLLPQAPASEQGELYHLLGWCHDALGQSEQAVAAFRQAIPQAPGRVSTYVLLGEVLSDRLGRTEEAAKVMDALVAANPQSAEALTARGRFLRGENPDRAARDLTRARVLQELAQARDALRTHPEASAAHYRLGLALLAAGSLEEATAELRLAAVAADLGSQQHAGLRAELARLFLERRLFAEADQVVRLAQQEGPLSRALARLGAEAALGIGDPQRAATLARQAVPATARDYRDLLWLGRLLDATDNGDEAEAILRAAVKQSPAVPDLWAALVGVLGEAWEIEEALATVAEARAKLPPERQGLGLARCYEVLDLLDQAEREYRKSLEARPDDWVLLRAASAFFRRTEQPRKAEPLLRHLLDPAVQAPTDFLPQARRHLAMVLAAGGTDTDSQEALTLLDQNRVRHRATPEDDRARALVLASRPGQQTAALRLFEDSLQGSPLSEETQFQLAQLCVAAGDPDRAARLVRDLLATSPHNRQYLAFLEKISHR